MFCINGHAWEVPEGRDPGEIGNMDISGVGEPGYHFINATTNSPLPEFPEAILSGVQEPTVTKCGVEIAEFSDGTTVMRQRIYLNKVFGSLRDKHRILTPDQFRGVFQVGNTLSETLNLFVNADDMQVDGDPGSRQYKGMSVPKKD